MWCLSRSSPQELLRPIQESDIDDYNLMLLRINYIKAHFRGISRVHFKTIDEALDFYQNTYKNSTPSLLKNRAFLEYSIRTLGVLSEMACGRLYFLKFPPLCYYQVQQQFIRFCLG